ncbi:putative sulfate:proton symporter (anion:anion symporter or antiporter of the sulfate permease SulP family) [Syntrophobacter sp. SbD1]|nr:putative sulfate:proton symporter (anion:anion symporter or antiporter of the sulfate permease SulP family) [Syntrophobacter sp. SbD1]
MKYAATVTSSIFAPLWIDTSTFKSDLMAGITVSLVAIPQSLAYARLAGVPAYYGLYAALIPTIIGAMFGSSRQLSTGPVAMTSLLSAASVAPLAAADTELFYSYVILLALLSGLFQILMGVFRIGAVLNFLSHPVLMGFINAAALIIGLAQLPTLLGIPAPHSSHFLLDILQVIEHINTMHALSLGFGVTAILMIVALKKYAPKLPGVLITVAALTWVSHAIGFADIGGKVVGAIPKGLPSFSIPTLDWHMAMSLVPAAFIIALVSFMEAMSSSKVIANNTRVHWDENKELVGQGLAKVAAAFCHSIPVSGSFSRSALNLASNARTGLSSVISAICVLLTLLFLTPLLYHLPKPVLAAIIMVAVVGLINFPVMLRAWRVSRDDGIASVATFAATLAFSPNIQNGILIGIGLSLGLMLYRMMQPRIAELGIHQDGTLGDAQRHNLPPLHRRLGAIRFDGALRFINVATFEKAVLEMERGNPEIDTILVSCGGINDLDASGVDMLSKLIIRFKSNNVCLCFSGFKGHVQDVIEKTGLNDLIGRDNLFATDLSAATELRSRLEASA